VAALRNFWIEKAGPSFGQDDGTYSAVRYPIRGPSQGQHGNASRQEPQRLRSRYILVPVELPSAALAPGDKGTSARHSHDERPARHQRRRGARWHQQVSRTHADAHHKSGIREPGE
jgi:hypothetical protein